MSRILLTGASGLIGSELLPLLLDEGHEVHTIGTAAVTGDRDGPRRHRCDLLDPESTRALVGEVRPELLVHLAWARPGGEDEGEHERWVEAGVALWDAFARAGGSKAMVAGTSAEYDWSRPLLSEDAPIDPASPYGRAKAELGRRLSERSSRDGVALVWTRLFWVYSAEPDSPRLIPAVARALVEGRSIATTDGRQVRDFVHAADAARALATVLAAPIEGAVNVGSGTGTQVLDILRALERLAGADGLVDVGAIPRRPGDPAELVADVSRLRSLGWQPWVDLERGLAATLERTRELLAAGR